MSHASRMCLAVPVIIGVISGTGTPLRSPESNGRPGMSAVIRLKTIAASQTIFARSCGNGGYARSLEQLATPPVGSRDGFVSAVDAEALGHDYGFHLRATNDAGPRDCHGSPTTTSFSATAVPIGEFGRRSYTLSRDGDIWYSESTSPPTEPFEKTGKRLQ